jgi:glycogen operon protein
MTKRVSEGSPEPLGLTLDARGANVAVFSAHARAIDLCLFDSRGETEIERLRLPCRTGDVFHGHFDGLAAGQRYGLRAHGPYAPAEGHRFNPAKLLADPYARALDRPFAYAPALLDHQPGGSGGDLRPDTTDSAPFMAKAIAIEPSAATPPPHTGKPWAGTVIYELHVRGFTKTHAQVPEAIRGTFAGLAHPAAIEHLVRLGVTAIEIMPPAAWVDERHLHETGLSNYWGYSPVTFMAPDPRLAPGGWAEIAASVTAIQRAGIEVLVDVVLNHTGEGDHLGPSLSLRGLDNATYFRLAEGKLRTPSNDTGCGNTLALDRPAVVRLATDALRTWAELGGVNGFRFDLATTLGRRDNGFDAAAPLLTAISQDPVLRKLRMIAEPWDIGPGGYQIGAFPALWGEWNDQYRDTMRKFWRGDRGLAGEAATRFSGSSDILAPRNRPPSRSVNFIVAHDGFTLADLVSYQRKHNEANGEDGRDGTDVNYSWNNGVEGVTGDPAVLAARRRDQRNLLATLLLARGTPMLTMGSESGHSQAGNNNAYAQDNATSWLDWNHADKVLTAFTARLIHFRDAHCALTRDRFLTGDAPDAALIPDAEWRNPNGTPMKEGDWHSERQSLIASFYAAAAEGRAADRVTLVLHAGREPLDVVLPEAREGYCWRLCLDTAEESGDGGGRTFDGGAVIKIAPRSVAALEECMSPAIQRAGGGAWASAESQFLDRLARAAGIAPDWYDIAGAKHIVPVSTKEVLLAEMGFAVGSEAQARESLGRLAEEQDRRVLPSTLVVHEGEPLMLRMAIRDGRTPTALVIEREDGTLRPVRLSPGDFEFESLTACDGRRFDTVLARLPSEASGRHRILLEHAPEIACQLTVAPKRCFLPPGLSSGRRAFGVAAQLYALRRNGDQGIGDFTTLGELSELAAKAGASTVGLNPLHALPSSDRERVSPYYPSDRRFLDPLYIDVAALQGGCTNAALAENAKRIAALSLLGNVDYQGVWALKRVVLEAHFADFNDMCSVSPNAADEFKAFIARGGTSLEQFACFEAIGEVRRGEAWHYWPAALKGRDPGALSAFAREHASLVRFHLFLQWLAHRQLDEAAARAGGDESWLGFYCDLAVGAAPDGAEVWSNADQFLHAASVGAPPDPFAEGGQNWGLRVPNPLAWRASGFRLFKEVVAANMAFAGALRIDHAMGLARLFVIPSGAKAGEGAYLEFPERDLFAQLALESRRARCLVVGEDLGTVPMHFRNTMDAADVLGYRVLWFERNWEGFSPAESYQVKTAACVSTHDLPTITGWWRGEDIREKEALGLISAEDAFAATRQRADEKRAFLRLLGLDKDLETGAVSEAAIIAAAHAFIRRTPSLLSIAQIDDLLGEVTSVNLPGTNHERMNWRRKNSGTMADVAAGLAALRGE